MAMHMDMLNVRACAWRQIVVLKWPQIVVLACMAAKMRRRRMVGGEGAMTEVRRRWRQRRRWTQGGCSNCSDCSDAGEVAMQAIVATVATHSTSEHQPKEGR